MSLAARRSLNSIGCDFKLSEACYIDNSPWFQDPTHLSIVGPRELKVPRVRKLVVLGVSLDER
eukprot:11226607-Lingulodinium_polyedra.AAC.1